MYSTKNKYKVLDIHDSAHPHAMGVSARASHVRAMSFGHPKNEKRDGMVQHKNKNIQNHDTTVTRARVIAQANLPMRELVRTPP